MGEAEARVQRGPCRGVAAQLSKAALRLAYKLDGFLINRVLPGRGIGGVIPRGTSPRVTKMWELPGPSSEQAPDWTGGGPTPIASGRGLGHPSGEGRASLGTASGGCCSGLSTRRKGRSCPAQGGGRKREFVAQKEQEAPMVSGEGALPGVVFPEESKKGSRH